MKQSLQFSSEIIRYDSISEVENHAHQELCEQALASLNHAYAPYSNYKVGASVLLEDGIIVAGNNQENAVYPLGLCAERVAIFSATSQHPELAIQALAVGTLKELNSNELPPFPCGSCRQVLLEMELRYNKDIAIYVLGSNRSVCVIKTVKDLLPYAFGKGSL